MINILKYTTNCIHNNFDNNIVHKSKIIKNKN